MTYKGKFSQPRTPGKQPGFTLIEVMIVVVIVAVLLTVALPGYQEQVRKTKRRIGVGQLMEIAAMQEQFFVNNKTYAQDLTNLGIADGTDGFEVDDDGDPVADASGASIYLIELASVSATSWTLQATPRNAQSKDTGCNVLSLTNTGERNVTGALGVDVCW